LSETILRPLCPPSTGTLRCALINSLISLVVFSAPLIKPVGHDGSVDVTSRDSWQNNILLAISIFVAWQVTGRPGCWDSCATCGRAPHRPPGSGPLRRGPRRRLGNGRRRVRCVGCADAVRGVRCRLFGDAVAPGHGLIVLARLIGPRRGPYAAFLTPPSPVSRPAVGPPPRRCSRASAS
jgi:hypothetical protein